MTWLKELPVTWLPEGSMAHSDTRLLDAYAVDLHEHEQRYGPLPWRGGFGRLRPLVEASGLTGRGGAGFPAWRKAAAVAGGLAPVVVANGAEGEPASAKDRTLMVLAPHLVLDGLQLAAEDVGAQRVYVYASGAAATAVRTALAQRTRVGRDRFPVEVVEAPERFLAGEESAVVAALNNRPAIPRDKARRVTEFGSAACPRSCTTSRPWLSWPWWPATAQTGSASSAPSRSRARSWQLSVAPSRGRVSSRRRTARPSVTS